MKTSAPRRWSTGDVVVTGLLCFFVFGAPAFWLLDAVSWRVFGLDGTSSTYSFNSASFHKQRKFLNRACDDGVCLHPTDWACGFTVDSHLFRHERFRDWHEAVIDCIGDVALKVEAWTALDRVRKVCGRHYMTFDPTLVGDTPKSREACSLAGGKWGEKVIVFTDEDSMLEKAGIDRRRPQ